MTVQGLRIPIIILVFIVALGTAVGAQQLFYRQQIVNPLQQEFLAIKGVQSVRLVKNGPLTDVHLKMGRVSDLESTYEAIQSAAKRGLTDRVGAVVLEDQRTQVLSEAYYQLHFAVQEAIATGHFTALADRLQELSAQYPFDVYRAIVADDHISIQLEHDKGYLYQIVPRQGLHNSAIGAGEGGGVT